MEKSLQELIELQTITNELIAQQNVNQLFTIGCGCAIIVCIVLYNAIKKFL